MCVMSMMDAASAGMGSAGPSANSANARSTLMTRIAPCTHPAGRVVGREAAMAVCVAVSEGCFLVLNGVRVPYSLFVLLKL